MWVFTKFDYPADIAVRVALSSKKAGRLIIDFSDGGGISDVQWGEKVHYPKIQVDKPPGDGRIIPP
jgi:hypothetical protein